MSGQSLYLLRHFLGALAAAALGQLLIGHQEPVLVVIAAIVVFALGWYVPRRTVYISLVTLVGIGLGYACFVMLPNPRLLLLSVASVSVGFALIWEFLLPVFLHASPHTPEALDRTTTTVSYTTVMILVVYLVALII